MRRLLVSFFFIALRAISSHNGAHIVCRARKNAAAQIIIVHRCRRRAIARRVLHCELRAVRIKR